MLIENFCTLTVKDYITKVSTPIKLYVNDKVRLRFKLQEYGLVEGTVNTRELRSIIPVACKMTIQKPLGLDTVEEATVDGDTVYIDIDSKYTATAGVNLLQIHLKTNKDYQRTLPPIKFEVRNTINEEMDGRPLEEVKILIDDKGTCFLSSNNEIIICK